MPLNRRELMLFGAGGLVFTGFSTAASVPARLSRVHSAYQQGWLYPVEAEEPG